MANRKTGSTRIEPVGWTRAYWHALEQFYWVPPYIGLKSVPRKLWSREGNRVSVPSELTSDNGPLYYRERKDTEFWPYVQRQEEPFNHLLDLTAAVLAPCDLAEIFRPLCNLPSDLSVADPAGRNLNTYLDWARHGNITQPDLFLVGKDALVMIEIKFNAKTSLDQFGKYLALALRHQDIRGPSRNVRLSYVLSASDPVAAVEKQLGVKLGDLSAISVATLAENVKNGPAREALLKNEFLTGEMLSKMQVNAMHWSDLHRRLLYLASSATDDPGGRTYARLLRGLAEAIELHPLSNVGTAEHSRS